MVKYIIYLAAAALIVWSVIYVLIALHRQWKGKNHCDSGGCASCGRQCRPRKTNEDKERP